MTSYLGCIKGETDSWVVLGEMEEGRAEMGRVQERDVIVYQVGDIHPDLCVTFNNRSRGNTVHSSRERR